MTCLRGAVLAAALGTVLLAQEPPPQASCTKGTRGTFWPLEANADRKVARQLIQAGELYMCTARAWNHRWELLAVNIASLEAGGSRKKAPPDRDDPASRTRLARK